MFKKILKQNSPGKYTLFNDKKIQIEGFLTLIPLVTDIY